MNFNVNENIFSDSYCCTRVLFFAKQDKSCGSLIFCLSCISFLIKLIWKFRIRRIKTYLSNGIEQLNSALF